MSLRKPQTFSIGDRVSHRNVYHGKDKMRNRIGTVKNIIEKKNRAGAVFCHYVVQWDHTSRTEDYLGHRLAPIQTK
ncbi:MAG: hypothetical protein Tp158DCM1229571_95 [Prokaryotic dsDNA virus sp.]|nr:MAG: hypothetical protein Tp158DCM1229571_95 [Prokaryotic dsDNA virus sp.]|tara:strand:+ start:11924 stop:12151 length:228 start_codon:yes stop_codon:yes gene_type:complete